MAVNCPICNNVLADDQASCPACGYHMLGTTETFNPVINGGSTASTKSDESHRYDLRVVRGPQTGIEIELHPGTLNIGRDPRCDIFLNDMTVSRNHAVMEVDPSGCIIRDMGSVNGVWVNDRVVEACSLRPGDLVQIGAFCLVFRERP